MLATLVHLNIEDLVHDQLIAMVLRTQISRKKKVTRFECDIFYVGRTFSSVFEAVTR